MSFFKNALEYIKQLLQLLITHIYTALTPHKTTHTYTYTLCRTPFINYHMENIII